MAEYLSARVRRLTRQVSAYYDEVAKALTVFPLSQHFDRSWAAHVAVKSALYEAESQMQAGAQHRLDDDINKEITRLKVRGVSQGVRQVFAQSQIDHQVSVF